jgi:uncharacterized membrane protein YadS
MAEEVKLAVIAKLPRTLILIFLTINHVEMVKDHSVKNAKAKWTKYTVIIIKKPKLN